MVMVQHLCGDCDDEDAGLNILDLDGDGFSSCQNDCNDGNEFVNPDADDCVMVDNNCDTKIDDSTARIRQLGSQIQMAMVQEMWRLQI